MVKWNIQCYGEGEKNKTKLGIDRDFIFSDLFGLDKRGRVVIQRLISSVPLGGEDKFPCLQCNAICQKLCHDSLAFCKSTRTFTSGAQTQRENQLGRFYDSGVFLRSDAVISDTFFCDLAGMLEPRASVSLCLFIYICAVIPTFQCSP